MNLRERIACQPDDVPNNFMTATQWGNELNLSPAETRRTLNKGIRLGIVIVKKFKIQTEQRGLYPTPHYKELPDDTKATAQTQGTSDGDRKHCDTAQPSNGQGFTRRQNAGRKAKAKRRAQEGGGTSGINEGVEMNQNDWQPIETAPRDGTWVLGWFPNQQEPRRCWYHKPSDTWMCFRSTLASARKHQPTHWMPLPKGPE